MRKKRPRSTFLWIAELVDRHFKQLLLAVAGMAVLLPIVVHGLYSFETPLIYTDISADALLGYLGSAFGWVVALFVSAIAVFQARKVVEAGEEQQERARKQEIKPSISIEVKGNDSHFELKFTNNSHYAAEGIYIYDTPLFAILNAQSSKNRAFVINECTDEDGVLEIYNPHVILNDDGIPEEIQLIYTDIDRNLITDTFKLYRDGDNYLYECTKSFY